MDNTLFWQAVLDIDNANTTELQQALEDLQAAESYLNEAGPAEIDQAICRYNAAKERYEWLVREAKLAMGLPVAWERWPSMAQSKLNKAYKVYANQLNQF